ncbi:hypothetical protein AAFF_G00405100 [Aldrovandia affinis]|uniref:Uncharacterized protein n=1 Tax=Aldrovandia affinis TaxID=143900 RepID=A0AAD7T8W3_9TELE|nr:hypothetical protein AAFF_G00405100 [Aldrovandia affinis]
MMNSDQCLDSPTSMRFEKKIIFSASQDLASIRSKGFVHLEKAKDIDTWELKAPDFSLKLYNSLNLPRKKKENRRPPLFASDSRKTLSGIKRPTQIVLPEINQGREPPGFTLRYRPPGVLESKLTFVKKGKYPSLAYSDPKPHDFRQYADDTPDIVTTQKKDPGNLYFKSQHLSTSIRRDQTQRRFPPEGDNEFI